MTKTLDELSEKLRDIDFCMLSTCAPNGAIASRPMSNNRDVEYDGDSFFFTCDETGTVEDIDRDSRVGLSFQGKSGLFGARPFFAAVEGNAELIRDKSRFEAHWTPALNTWFDEGVDTPGLVMLKVTAERIHYWEGMEAGEINVKEMAGKAPG